MTTLGVVVIGRNEGDRLVRCLASIGDAAKTIYVDSGSTDDSIANARRAGAEVVELDVTVPFTAARARNAGRVALGARAEFIQFVDGDCVLRPGWLTAARAALAGDPSLVAVFGRLREAAPGASIYNWLCDVEWNVPPGAARYIGGNAMVRARALDAAGGYDEAMIAGEEPDLSIRLRARGGRIVRLPFDMALHDAAMTRFGQWWRRAERSGHAYADLAERHRGPAGADYRRGLGSALIWTAMPLIGFGLVIWAGQRSLPMAAGFALLILPAMQLARVTLREARSRPPRDAMSLAIFLMLAKPAQAIGAARYALTRARGRRGRLIEYKGTGDTMARRRKPGTGDHRRPAGRRP